MKSSDRTFPETPRIASITNPTAEQAELLRKSHLKDGTLPNAMLTLVHNAPLLKRINDMGAYFLRHSILPERTIKLVIIRTAHRANSLYEFAIHSQTAISAGLLSAAEVGNVVNGSDDWSEQDKLYLKAVDDLFEFQCVSEETWQQLAAIHPSSALIELVVLIGFYQGIAGFLNSAGVEVDRHLEVRSWPSGRLSVR